MLSSLHIENYALIQRSDIDFDSGFVAITGETGAGKSIMLGALALLLGGRADSKVLYEPERKCVVEALFHANGQPLKQLFDSEDVDYGSDGDIIIRREILPSGKSRAFVNDTPVGLSFLKQLGASLIDIHSQHATLLLGDSAFQTSLLDILAANGTLLDEYRKQYLTYSSLKKELEQLTSDEQQKRKDYDYNKFLFDELEAAQLVADEQEQLEQESSLLANAEDIKSTLSQIANICDSDEDSALSRLNSCKSLLSKLTHLGNSKEGPLQFQSLYERLESSLIELRDIVASLEEANESTLFSPQRQQEIDDRLAVIYRLQKKHGVDSISKLLDIKDDLDRQLSDIDDASQRIQQVMEAVDKAYKSLQTSGEKLTASRRKGALLLEKQIKPLLGQLGMPNATLNAIVEETDNYGVMGCNRVTLFFNANKGGEAREICKVASGGEMSRLMLAIKSLTAKAGLLPTVIFDEIDTGISGDISVRVADIMRHMSEGMQVIAITHLPQIAAKAVQHYKVYKGESGSRTISNIRQLANEERIHELAVMLSSEPPSEAALQTAAELMN